MSNLSMSRSHAESRLGCSRPCGRSPPELAEECALWCPRNLCLSRFGRHHCAISSPAVSSLSSRQNNVISLSLKTLAVGCNQANVKFRYGPPPGTRQTHGGVPAHREGMGHRKVSPYSSELPEARIRWLSPRSQPAPVELKITSVSVVTLPDGMMQLSRSAEREAFDNLTRIATPTQTQNTSATHAAAHLNLAGLTAGQRRQHR